MTAKGGGSCHSTRRQKADLKYAGTQQFGAAKGQYGSDRQGRPIPWGDVPQRAYLPVRMRGGPVDLPRGTRSEIVDVLSRHLFAR